MITTFSHLFSSPVGYGAGYYSYLWAKVLDADAFSRFEKEGIFNSETGSALREAIISKGNSDDPMKRFTAFMGREPSIEALLRRAGIVAAD
jgi:oligopeptidase A